MITVYAEHRRKAATERESAGKLNIAEAASTVPETASHARQVVVDANDQSEATRSHAEGRVRNGQTWLGALIMVRALVPPRIEGIRVTGHRWSWVEWLA